MLIQADARRIPLADGSVQCCVTSPPYWSLRDYGLPPSIFGGDAECEHAWEGEECRHPMDRGGKYGGSFQPQARNINVMEKPVSSAFCALCGAWRGCLGLEPTPELYVAHMVEVFREVWRVLRDDGTVWLNLGDSYIGRTSDANSGTRDKTWWLDTARAGQQNITGSQARHTRSKPPGLKPKDLVGIPWRVAFALQADGWWLRSDIIWHKPNPMPESVTDRPTKSHEYLFLLTKSKRYFYDAEAIAENTKTGPGATWKDRVLAGAGLVTNKVNSREHTHGDGSAGTNLTRQDGRRNRRTVWKANPQIWRLKAELSDDDRAYVLGELVRRDLLSSNPNSNDDQPE